MITERHFSKLLSSAGEVSVMSGEDAGRGERGERGEGREEGGGERGGERRGVRIRGSIVMDDTVRVYNSVSVIAC